MRAVFQVAKFSRPTRFALSQLNCLLQKAGLAPSKGGSCSWECWIYKSVLKNKVRVSSVRMQKLDFPYLIPGAVSY